MLGSPALKIHSIEGKLYKTVVIIPIAKRGKAAISHWLKRSYRLTKKAAMVNNIAPWKAIKAGMFP